MAASGGGGHFAYNAAYSHVNTTVIHNTYVNRVTINNTVVNNHTSFNGGTGGIQARPQPQELAAEHENHVQPTAGSSNSTSSRRVRIMRTFASANGGRPQVAAMARPGAMNTAVPARGVEAARAGNQQQRIANGVGSGQMTARETTNVERREGNINQTARTDRQANGGTLTGQERANLNQRQNNVSGSIYQDKHNAAVQPQARPQAAAPRPQPQARPQAAPHPQAAPRAEGHAEGGERRR